MGIYRVQSNGKSPTGLQVGDQVVTYGGTYIITGVRDDGSYSSVLYDPAQTVDSYRGSYDTPGVPSAAAQAQQSAVAAYQQARQSKADTAADTAALEDRYLALLEQALNGASAASAASGASGASGAMSLEEAVKLARQSLEPSYAAAYRQAATSAAQRLDKAGLYDSVYGQALAEQAENEVSEDLNAAVYKLALQLTQDSADYSRQQQESALNYLMKLLQLKEDVRQSDQDVAARLQTAAMKL